MRSGKRAVEDLFQRGVDGLDVPRTLGRCQAAEDSREKGLRPTVVAWLTSRTPLGDRIQTSGKTSQLPRGEWIPKLIEKPWKLIGFKPGLRVRFLLPARPIGASLLHRTGADELARQSSTRATPRLRSVVGSR
jgi:hypothetical protein